MREQNRAEYSQTRIEIIRTQDCITDYLKAFFAFGGSIATIALIISRLGIAVPSMANFIYPSFGFIIIGFAFIVVSFGSIMFHKFITHNRYTGYAQAISFEEKHGDDIARLPADCFFWEFCLFIIHNEPIVVSENASPNERAIYEYIGHCDAACKFIKPNIYGIADPSEIVKFLRRSIIGAYMAFRAPINKVQTQSWTYPYFVAFGTFVILAGLMASLMAIIIVSVSGDTLLVQGHLMAVKYQVMIQCLFALYLSVCWLGMFNRLYRVCAPDGDRTVLYYFYSFALARQKALKRYGIPYDWPGMPMLPARRATSDLPGSSEQSP
jgi:hypothetical protein